MREATGYVTSDDPKQPFTYISNQIHSFWWKGWALVRNYVTSRLVIKRARRTEDDEERERSRRGPMPRRRRNKTPRADLMNGERLWQQSSRKFSFVLKEENWDCPCGCAAIKKTKEAEHFWNKRCLARRPPRTQSSAAPSNLPAELLLLIRPPTTVTTAVQRSAV